LQPIKKHRFNKTIRDNLVEKITLSELHPIIRQHYLPQITKRNGNCLFNMISISLIRNESLANVLRALTVYTIIKNKNEYLGNLRRELSASSMINIDINIDEKVNRKYNSILLEAKTDKTWCNEYHLLAISTFLNSDVYIYIALFLIEEMEFFTKMQIVSKNCSIF
jgi:hypothetical protein